LEPVTFIDVGAEPVGYEHDGEDAFFLVVSGELHIDVEDHESVVLGPHQSYTMPRGVVDRTRAANGRTAILVFEAVRVAPTRNQARAAVSRSARLVHLIVARDAGVVGRRVGLRLPILRVVGDRRRPALVELALAPVALDVVVDARVLRPGLRHVALAFHRPSSDGGSWTRRTRSGSRSGAGRALASWEVD
jgi:hypothetical protein